MPTSNLCSSAIISLDEIKQIKQKFDQAYEALALSNSPVEIKTIQELKELLVSRIESLKEIAWMARAEREHHFREQYDQQVDLLKRFGFAQTKTEHSQYGEDYEVLYIKGIDNQKYPLPSYNEIMAHIAEKNDLMRMKEGQGFNRLVLVPFAMGLDRLIEGVKKYLLEYQTRESRTFDVDVDQPILYNTRKDWTKVDREGKLLYDPLTSKKGGNQGKSKKNILKEDDKNDVWNHGWRILLLQGDSGTKGIKPAFGYVDKIEQGDVETPDTNKSPEQYLEWLIQATKNRASSQFGESGMTMEEWLLAFIVHLESTGQPLDDADNGSPTPILTGTCYAESERLFFAYFSRDLKAIRLAERSTGYALEADGHRTAVRI